MDEVLMVAMQAFELIHTVVALQGLLLQGLSMKHPGYHMSTSIYRVVWYPSFRFPTSRSYTFTLANNDCRS